MWPSASRSAAGRFPATTWWDTSPWARASPYTAATARTSVLSRRTRSGSPPCIWSTEAPRPSAWRSRSRPTTAAPAGGHLAHPERKRGQHPGRSDPDHRREHGEGPLRVRGAEIEYLETSCSASAASTRSMTPTGSRPTRRGSHRARPRPAVASPPLDDWPARRLDALSGKPSGTMGRRHRRSCRGQTLHEDPVRACRPAAGQLLRGKR